MSGAAPFADALSRFVFERAAVRGELVSLDETCRQILGCHPYPPALARALSELLAASALLASTLKFKGALVVQLQGSGPVRLLVVECDANLDLRATAEWSGDADALPADAPLALLAGDIAKSRLAITLDPKDGGPIYQGIVALEATSVATLIEHYLSTSEQIDSRMLLASENGRVRGLLLQRLPGATSADDATWKRATTDFERIGTDELLATGSAKSLLAGHFPDDDLRLFPSRVARFHCNCSLERVASVLRMLGRTEVESILADQGLVGVTCEFCNRAYTFVADEARALFERRDTAADAPPESLKH
jgi:molecular chaperone Hsp33